MNTEGQTLTPVHAPIPVWAGVDPKIGPGGGGPGKKSKAAKKKAPSKKK